MRAVEPRLNTQVRGAPPRLGAPVAVWLDGLQGSRIVLKHSGQFNQPQPPGHYKAKGESILSGNKPSAHRAGQSDDSWRPSLFLDPDQVDERAPGTERPLRMLAALQEGGSSRPVAKSRGASGGKSWLWTTALAAVGTVGFVIAIYVGTTDAAGDVPASDLAIAPPVASQTSTVPTTPAEPSLAVASANALPASPAPVTDAAASQSLATSEPSGPAKLEIRNDGLAALPGMAAAAQAVAAERAGSASDVTIASAGVTASPVVSPAPTASQATLGSNAPTPTRAEHHAPAVKPAVAKSSATAKASAPAESATRRVVKPTAQATARKQPTGSTTPNDPDAELVAAIMARMEGSRGASERSAPTSNERSNTIAALVRDCNALPDSGSALACRRRICEGYWGKAQACPRSMAPQAAAAVNSSSTAN